MEERFIGKFLESHYAYSVERYFLSDLYKRRAKKAEDDNKGRFYKLAEVSEQAGDAKIESAILKEQMREKEEEAVILKSIEDILVDESIPLQERVVNAKALSKVLGYEIK